MVREFCWIWRVVAGVVVALLLGEAARAGGGLPLEGYYRPGRYMPVVISNAPGGGKVCGEGGVGTEVPAGAGEIVVPWLPLRKTVRQVLWCEEKEKPQPIQQTLRLLEEKDRLVGVVDGDETLAEGLFPGRRVIVLHLNQADPLPGPAAAWGTLDAVLLDAPALARIDPVKRSVLISSGVMLAVQSDSPPKGGWPWRRMEKLWVLGGAVAGPRQAEFNEEAYEPTWSWAPGWPVGLRRGVVWAGGVFALLVLLLSLLQRRWAIGGVALLTVAALAAGEYWRRWQSPLLQAGGAVLVRDGGLLQRDGWFYQTAMEGIDSGFAFEAVTWPVYAGEKQFDDLPMTLLCGEDGSPRLFAYRLPGGMRIAFLRRTVSPAAAIGSDQAEVSPLRTMAREMYLQAGEQLKDIPVDMPWGGVAIERNSPSTHAAE